MEYNIGSKLKAARMTKKLTQEQLAERLGVSRQTISNWETGKSFPDILSVIKMSECCEVSLDDLLKGEQKMNTYYDYLEESTNVVKSNTRRSEIITLLSYLLIWAGALIVFWCFMSGADALGYALLFFYIILPATTLTVSVIIGRRNFFGEAKWALTLFFGVMYMLADYGTFRLANNIAADKLNAPTWEMLVAGTMISLVGMLAGLLLKWVGSLLHRKLQCWKKKAAFQQAEK